MKGSFFGSQDGYLSKLSYKALHEMFAMPLAPNVKKRRRTPFILYPRVTSKSLLAYFPGYLLEVSERMFAVCRIGGSVVLDVTSLSLLYIRGRFPFRRSPFKIHK